MKKLIYIFILSIMSIFVYSCEEKQVGYLVTESASYSINNMVVRIDLDGAEATYIPLIYEMWESWAKESGKFTDIHHFFLIQAEGDPKYMVGKAGIDYARNRYKLPWETTVIEGIRGTNPMKVYVHSAKTKDGNEKAMLESLKVRGDGTMTIPLTHSVPVGTYVISLRVENEGYTQLIYDCYTFNVVQNIESTPVAE